MNAFVQYIYNQVDGFFKAGKKIAPPENKFEFFISRLIASIMLIFMIVFYLFIFLGSGSIHPRIITRSLLYMAPLISFVVMFYKGVSISWMMAGLAKYWLFPAYLVLIAIVLIQIFIEILFPYKETHAFLNGSFMMISTGVIFGIYYRINIKKTVSGKNGSL